MLQIVRLVFCIAAVFQSSAVAADEYAFVLKGRGNPFWKVIVQGIEETAKQMGVKAAVYQIENDQASEAQLNLCLTALERNPKVLVLGAVTKSVGIQCYAEAMKRGIPSGDIDGNVSVADAGKENVQLAFSVGSDNYLIGRKAAEYLKSISKRSDPKIFALAGLPGNVVSQQRISGFQDGIKALLPDAKLVGTLSADWDRLKAANITNDVLQREETLDFIFSASDVMTYGIIESVKAAGRAEQTSIISVDGNADIRDAIRKGRVAASVAQLPYLMGKRSVEVAVALTHGSVAEPAEFTATPVLTKKLLENPNDPILEFVR